MRRILPGAVGGPGASTYHVPEPHPTRRPGLPHSPRAALLTPHFADRDAVCNDVHHSAEALRRRGWEARVFAMGGESERERVHPVAEVPGFIRDPADIVYFHFSHGQKTLTDAVEAVRCRKVLKFHNVTPPEFFSMWSDALAEASRTGREGIPRVAAMGWERVFADSAYNLSEIAAHLPPGTPQAVLAPFHETDALLAARPAGVETPDPPRLLTVGRVVQSKGHPFLLRVVRYLVQELRTPVVLDVVGKPDHRLLAYLRTLELMVREFGIEANVSFHGEVSGEALARRYAESSVFVMGSEHEGFCVPIVEAMAFAVPVVALGTTAVPETVGEAGIVWPERDPRRFAVSIRRLLDNPPERAWLGEHGRRRFAERFDNRIIAERFAVELGLGGEGTTAAGSPGR